MSPQVTLRRQWSPLSHAVIAALGIVFGLLVVLTIVAVTNRLSTTDEAVGSDVVVFEEVEHESIGAATPRDAVAQFLDAEVADDWAGSFELLSSDDKNHFLADENWAMQRVGTFGSVESWEWSSSDGGVEADDARTDLTFTPIVSVTDGIRPAKGTISWSLVDEDGWRVSLAGSSIEASLPSDEGALDAAREWLSVCDEPEAIDPVFLGSNSKALTEACARGVIDSDAVPVAPTGRTAADMTVAFGPSAPGLVRVVPTSEPGDLAVVVAPLGDAWIVIDVVAD